MSAAFFVWKIDNDNELILRRWNLKVYTIESVNLVRFENLEINFQGKNAQ